MLDYQQSDPTPDVADFVRCVWTLRGDSDGTAQPIVSDGCVEIVINLADPFLRTADDGSLDTQPAEMIVGPTSRPTVVRPTGTIDLVGIRLQPWAASAFLGLSMTELRGRYVSAGDIGNRALKQLGERLSEALPSNRIALVSSEIREMAQRPVDRLARALVTRVTNAREVPGVRDLSMRAGCSVRTVERVFSREVGLNPKTLLRLVRIQRVLTLAMEQPETSWTRIAFMAGYHDQPHFVHDFRELVGCTPSEFRPDVETLTSSFIVNGGD